MLNSLDNMTTEGNNVDPEDRTKIVNDLFEDGNARYSSIPDVHKNRIAPEKSGYSSTSEHGSQAEFRQLSDAEIDGADMRQIILWIA